MKWRISYLLILLILIMPSYAILTDKLLAAWSFENNINDTFGLNNWSWTDSGDPLNPTYNDGILDMALNFTPENSFANRSNFTDFNNNPWIMDNISIAFWARVDNFSNYDYQTFFNFYKSNSAFLKLKYILSSDTFELSCSLDHLHVDKDDIGFNQTNTWYFLVQKFDRSTKNCSLSINGVVKMSYIVGVAIDEPFVWDSRFFCLGADGCPRPANQQKLYGLLDEFYIWNRTLNQSEIDNLYNSGIGLFYPFGEGGDTIPSLIALNNPQDNSNITSMPIIFNWTAIDNMDTVLNCSLKINGNIEVLDILSPNNTMISYSVSGLTTGSYLWNVTCLDDMENSNTSETRIFNVDLEIPLFSSLTDNTNSLTLNGTGLFGVTVENTNGSVYLEIDGQNITASNVSNIYNATHEFTASGTYPYSWHSWGNGTQHIYTSSDTRNYKVKAYSVVNIGIGQFGITTPNMILLFSMIVIWLVVIIMQFTLKIPILGVFQLIIGLFIGVILSSVHILLCLAFIMVSLALLIEAYMR